VGFVCCPISLRSGSAGHPAQGQDPENIVVRVAENVTKPRSSQAHPTGVAVHRRRKGENFSDRGDPYTGNEFGNFVRVLSLTYSKAFPFIGTSLARIGSVPRQILPSYFRDPSSDTSEPVPRLRDQSEVHDLDLGRFISRVRSTSIAP
jgi:hypothetical protein